MYKGDKNSAPLGLNKRHPGWSSADRAGKMPVMIVDDDRHFLEMLSMVLTHHYDCAVTKAGNAFEALGHLEGKNFSFIITDFQMPGMDGLTLASTIKRRDPAINIILITGLSREALQDNQGLDNIDLYIQKPFKMGTFLENIADIVNRKALTA